MNSTLHEAALAGCLRKLERHGRLSAADRHAFLNLPHTEDQYEAHHTVVVKGSDVKSCIFVNVGLMSRVKVLPNGLRQIVAFFIPGDAADLQSLLLPAAVDDLCTNSLTQLVSIKHSDIRAMIVKHPNLAYVLWQDTLVEAAILREWTVNVGKRRATERIAHLLLEMDTRFAGSAISSGTYMLQLTQTELSQAVALSLVHLNKSLQSIRRAGMVEMKSGRVTILDRKALEKLCDFNPSYIDLRRHCY